MSETLLIQYRGPDAPLAWLELDPRGQSLRAPGTGQRLDPAALAGVDRVIVLLPAERATVLAAEVPARGREQLAKAVPFAVEDRLIDPLEALHLTFDELPEGGQRVVALRQDLLAEWLADLRARGVAPDAARLDVLALPWRPDRASLAIDVDARGQRRALVRCGPAAVWSGIETELGDWFDVLAADLPSPRPVDVHGRDEPAAALRAVAAVRVDAGRETLAALADEVSAGRAGPELLAGRFTPARRGARGRQLRRWGLGLAAAAALLVLADLVLANLALSRRADALAAAQLDLYREAYPGAPDTPDPRARIEADLGGAVAGSARGDALELVATVAPLLTRSTRHVLTSLEYRNGALEVALQGEGLAALDQVRESIAATPGLDAELAQVNAAEQGTEGRIVIRAKAP
jgi:general secretion pathway protein L